MLSQVPRKKKRFYYDVNISNNRFTNPSGQPYIARFSETRNSPLFNDAPDKYCLSVVRFSVPSTSIPYQYISTIYDEVNPANPNKMTYSISLEYNGTVHREYLQWKTQVAFVPIPAPPPLAGPDTRFKDAAFNLYYAMYNLNHFCDIINEAFQLCFTTHVLPFLPPAPPGKSYSAPYVTFEGITNLFTIWVSDLFLGDTPTVVMGGNYLFNSNFSTSWDTLALGVNLPDGLDFRWVFIQDQQNAIPNSGEVGDFTYRFRQEFDTTGSISEFQSLLIVSPTLACNTDMVSNASAPQSQGAALDGNNFGSVAGNFLPLITDFEIDQSSVSNLKGYIHYIPSAEYRRLTMRGREPITQVSIDIFWRDIFGNIYPIILPDNSAATIKILFEEQ